MHPSGVHMSFSCSEHLSKSRFASCKILMAELLVRSETFTFFRLISPCMGVFTWLDVGFCGLFTGLLGLLQPLSSLLFISLFSGAEMRFSSFVMYGLICSILLFEFHLVWVSFRSIEE